MVPYQTENGKYAQTLYTVWLVIFRGCKIFVNSRNKASELVFVVLIFVTATWLNERAACTVCYMEILSDWPYAIYGAIRS